MAAAIEISMDATIVAELRGIFTLMEELKKRHLRLLPGDNIVAAVTLLCMLLQHSINEGKLGINSHGNVLSTDNKGETQSGKLCFSFSSFSPTDRLWCIYM